MGSCGFAFSFSGDKNTHIALLALHFSISGEGRFSATAPSSSSLFSLFSFSLKGAFDTDSRCQNDTSFSQARGWEGALGSCRVSFSPCIWLQLWHDPLEFSSLWSQSEHLGFVVHEGFLESVGLVKKRCWNCWVTCWLSRDPCPHLVRTQGTSCDTMSVSKGEEGRIWFHLHYHEKYFIWLHPHGKWGHRLLVYHKNKWEESISFQNML